MGTLYEQYDCPELPGSEITIDERFPAIYISERGEIFCYTGIKLRGEKRREVHLETHPYYLHGKHSTAKESLKQIEGFFRIANGCIYLDDYVDNQYSVIKYKHIERFICYPAAAEIYYGIMSNPQEEDEELTRAVFGLTCYELRMILEGYSRVLGISGPYIQYPRLTRSVRSANYCDLNDLWIPEQFPYIAFQESSYDFSHVSLWGFYRHLQLLMRGDASSPLGRVMMDNGVDKSILQTLLDIRELYGYTKKVIKI
jgi:hypothetical protein